MNPNVWGKYQWTSIHFSALGYPNHPSVETKNSFKRYFNEILPEILPCEGCRQHLRETLKYELPITDKDLENKHNLFKWTVDLHNIVNKRLKKPTLSLHNAYNIYMYQDNLYNAMCSNTTPLSITTLDITSFKKCSIYNILIILIIIFLLILYIYYFKIWRRIIKRFYAQNISE